MRFFYKLALSLRTNSAATWPIRSNLELTTLSDITRFSIYRTTINHFYRSTMTTRPRFIKELLARPLPLLTPPHLSDKSNPPYSVDIQNQIADLQCHPLLESAVSFESKGPADI
jgi:hypothetical protein